MMRMMTMMTVINAADGAISDDGGSISMLVMRMMIMMLTMMMAVRGLWQVVRLETGLRGDQRVVVRHFGDSTAMEISVALGAVHTPLRMWHVTDIAWPRPPAAYDAYLDNAKVLQHYGVRCTGGVDAFDIASACRRMGIHDVDSVGLVLWSGPHSRRHDGKDMLLQTELNQHLQWARSKFIVAAMDMVSSDLPQATVILCDVPGWEEGALFPLNGKPLATFRTHYGTVDGLTFRSEASGFDDRHVRPWDSDQFLGCGLVAPFLQNFVLGEKVVDIPKLALLVAEAGLHVIFLGEYTCAQSRHCLRRALAEGGQTHRMLCDQPWSHLSAPRRHWKRGSGAAYSLQEFRDDAEAAVKRGKRCHAEERWTFHSLHAANNWAFKAQPQGRAGASDFGHVMFPAPSFPQNSIKSTLRSHGRAGASVFGHVFPDP